MRSVKITVDGIEYVLRENSNGEWLVTNQAPYVSGEYPVTVVATTEAGQTIQLDVDDPELEQALMLIVIEGTTIHGHRMLNYYPQVIQRILEFQALMHSEGFEIDFLNDGVDVLLNDAYLTTMGEERITAWEQNLGLTYDKGDTLEDRRDAIIARIRSQGKLNTASINTIVNAFTGGTAISYVENSTLYVKITPPPTNKQYKFENVERELMKKKPAHLGLNVKRNYATWGEVRDNFASWDAVSQLDSWQDLMLWIAPQ